MLNRLVWYHHESVVKDIDFSSTVQPCLINNRKYNPISLTSERNLDWQEYFENLIEKISNRYTIIDESDVMGFPKLWEVIALIPPSKVVRVLSYEDSGVITGASNSFKRLVEIKNLFELPLTKEVARELEKICES